MAPRDLEALDELQFGCLSSSIKVLSFLSAAHSQTTWLVSWISKALTLISRGGQQLQMRVDFSYPHRPFRLITCGYPIVRSYALDLFP